VRFCAASEQSLLVYLGEEIGNLAHQRVVQLLRALQKEPIPWIRNIQPAYCSLLITFDAAVVDHSEVQTEIIAYAKRAEGLILAEPRLVEIPVCYGGEFGPDLQDVATTRGLPVEKVIELHAAPSYHSYFLGFAPGFAYLGDLPLELTMPRLDTPRKAVAAGSVAIAGRQTAVYPFATPGGWRLIGRTPLEIFRNDREPMGLIAIGDRVKFKPITREEFAAMRRT
jgi:inhibitor of KinA